MGRLVERCGGFQVRLDLVLLPFAVPRRLGAVAAGRHVAPAAAAVLCGIEEDPRATRIGATTDARQLAGDQRIGRRLDHRYYQAGESVTDGHERPGERAVRLEVDATRAGAAPEHAIDLAQCVEADSLADDAALGERTERGAYAARIDQ